MILRVVEEAKVGRCDAAEGKRTEASKTLSPLFEMQFRRWGGDADVIYTGKPNAAYVSGEADIVKKIGHVVCSVTGGVDGGELEAANGNRVAVGEGGQVVERDWEKFAPEGFHLITVDAFCAGEEAFGVKHMLRAKVVNVDIRAVFGEPARRSGMVEVNMGEENMGNV
jgi:hypothetical protein